MRAFRIAYDGRPFHGFQRQPDVPTVEEAVFDAANALGVADGKPAGYAAAGRTDAGVSAVAQTVAFECPDWLTPAALNSELPASVRAWASADAPDDFHATHDAASRAYRYHCHAPEADLARAEQALGRLRGENDFHNLTPDDENTVRELQADAERDDDYLVFDLRAGGFVREMVRRVVSLVRAVATGDASLAKVERVLGPEKIDGPEGVAPAPAYPLVLVDAAYPMLTFSVDDDAAASTRELFAALRDERATRTRVAAEVVEQTRVPEP
ncbi:tRNA pseudouridine(38-40) synthase TruA [Halorussus gelatinilyticus]|uniref:tRNA pseudouridine synthase A n=1 Tax=Halorussus gelatinilyticus TaxID=2937524 RepID=A0A8U0IMK5_9EURY|nr:tRNA pseudouridine(38-40) synthase TruA [Halorussus gelatinilyticus]UPW02377.1 tRNA pseudouridine(38-40) synthase TruA [Halorussus gelatinilyticus]